MIEEFHFWALAHYFMKEQDYRILHISKDHKEIWLENPDSKNTPFIRLFNCVLDWSSWLERDIQLTAMNGEKVRKQKYLKSLKIINVYISPYPPVDDYEHRINKIGEFDHTHIETIIISRGSVIESFAHLRTKFPSFELVPILEEHELTTDKIDEIKKRSLQISINRIQAERKIFNYGKPFFTYILIAIHLIIFFLLEINGGSKNSLTLVEFGAKFNPLIIAGEWWRFITPMFLHIGFLHLIMNSLGLYYLGTAVEKIYGNVRFFWIYLFAGVIGSIASFGFSPNLSAGASGAIYGCFGALLYIGVVYPKLFFRTLGKNLITILILNIVISVTVPQIDLAGHLGGLVGGFVATGVVHFPKKKKYLSQFFFLILTASLTISLLFFGFSKPEKYKSENESVYFELSYIEIQLGMLKEAEINLNRAIELNPNFHEAHFNLALILIQQQDYKQAEEHVRKAVEIDPEIEKYQEILKKMYESQ